MSNVYVDIDYKTLTRIGDGLKEIIESDINTIKKVELCKLPNMIKSKACILNNTVNKQINYEECEYDEGGYFIINGSEKVLISQEIIINNKIYVFPIQ